MVPAGVGGPAARIWGLRREGMSWRDLGIRSVGHVPIFNAPYIIAAFVLGIGVVLGAGPGDAPLAVALAPVGVVVVGVLLFFGIAGSERGCSGSTGLRAGGTRRARCCGSCRPGSA